MRPIQLLLDFFILAALCSSFLKYRQKKIKAVELGFWALLWLAAFLLVSLPDTTAFLARILGIGRGVDLVIYVSGVLTFYLLFRLYEKIDRIEREITEIVRHVALSEEKKKQI